MLFFGHLYFSLLHLQHIMKNRSRSEIKAQIIKTIGNKGAIQSKIMYEVYLSFVQMKRYLDSLQQKKFITYDAYLRIFRLTDKGKHFFSLYSKMTESLVSLK